MCRILHIVYQMGRGGIETWLMHVFRAMDRSRFQFDFVVHSSQPGVYDDEIKALGGRMFRCCHPSNPLLYALKFDQLLKANGPYDAIHSHGVLWELPVMSVARFRRVPVRVVQCHCDMGGHRMGMLRDAYARLTMQVARRFATHGLAASAEAASSYFGGNWANDGRWRVMGYGENLEPFRQVVDRGALRKQLGIEQEALVIGHIGRFFPPKNHAFLVRLFADLLRLKPGSILLLIGDGPLKQDAKNLASTLGIDKSIIFLSNVPDVACLLKGVMDVFVFPSLTEGLGNVMIEAQAAGLPCVCSDVVPDEATVVRSLVRRVPLSLVPGEWARIVLDTFEQGRSVTPEEALEQIEATEFNIENSLATLLGIYTGKSRNGRHG